MIAYPTTAPLVLNHPLADPIRGYCTQGSGFFESQASTAGQPPPLVVGASVASGVPAEPTVWLGPPS